MEQINTMTKLELAKKIYVQEELDNIDFSIPESFFNNLKENNVNPSLFVYDYNDNKLGLPVNLLEKALQKGLLFIK